MQLGKEEFKEEPEKLSSTVEMKGVRERSFNA